MTQKNGGKRSGVDGSRRKFVAGAAGLLASTGARVSVADNTRSTMLPGMKIISKTDPEYEQWRQGLVWQAAKPERKPALIAQAKSVDDVIDAVDYARRSGTRLIAKSGGHSLSGSFLRDNGMLLNMLRMQQVEVDPARQTVSAQPGTWGPVLLNALEKENLAFPVARGGSVSIGGFLLGGGLGFNPNTWRVGCFSVIGADVVTADGKLLSVDANRHPDLYWAVRGAGPGFFGVVTRYHLRAYAMPGDIRTSQYIHPLDDYEKIATALETLVPTSDYKLELILLLTSNPDRDAVAAGAPAQVCLVNVNAYGDSEAESRQLLESIARSPLAEGTLAKKEYQPTSLRVMTGETGTSFPRGRMATEGIWSHAITPVISTYAERLKQAATPITTISMRFMGNDSLPDDAAFSLLARTNALAVLTWQDEKDDTRVNAWLKETMQAVQPWSIGHYINNEDIVSYPERNRKSFSAESWNRLRALKKEYDPEGVFEDYFGVESRSGA